MIISEFPEQNTEFGKPESMDHTECNSLPAFQDKEKNVIVSCWKFTDEEMLLSLLERRLWIVLHFPVQPPILPSPQNPFINPDGTYDEIETVIDRLLDRKIEKFLSDYKDCGEDELKDVLKQFSKFLVSTK